MKSKDKGKQEKSTAGFSIISQKNNCTRFIFGLMRTVFNYIWRQSHNFWVYCKLWVYYKSLIYTLKFITWILSKFKINRKCSLWLNLKIIYYLTVLKFIFKIELWEKWNLSSKFPQRR